MAFEWFLPHFCYFFAVPGTLTSANFQPILNRLPINFEIFEGINFNPPKKPGLQTVISTLFELKFAGHKYPWSRESYPQANKFDRGIWKRKFEVAAYARGHKCKGPGRSECTAKYLRWCEMPELPFELLRHLVTVSIGTAIMGLRSVNKYFQLVFQLIVSTLQRIVEKK